MLIYFFTFFLCTYVCNYYIIFISCENINNLKEHYMTGIDDLIRQYLFQIEALQKENQNLEKENQELKKKNEMQSAQLVAGKNYAFDNTNF